MSNPWTEHYSNNFRVVPSQSAPGSSYISAPISSTPAASASASPIFQQTTISSNISLQHLYADVKTILQSLEASLEEQKKISKDLNEVGTTVNVLEGVLCGKRKKKKKGKNMDLDTLQSEGGIVRRLATMDSAINRILAHVSRLDTASLCRDASTTARTSYPPLQKEYLDTSTSTDEPPPASAPPPCLLEFRHWFPPLQHSPETLSPASWNTNHNNSYRASAFARSRAYIHSVQRDSSSPESTEYRASPDSRISPDVFKHVLSSEIADISSRSATSITLHASVPINGPDISSPLPTPSPETSLEECFSRTNESNSRSLAAPPPRPNGPDQNVATTSFRTFPNSLLNPIPPSSTNSIHKSARTFVLSAFRSFDSKSNSATSHFTHTLTSPSTSSKSGSSNYNISSPASRIAPMVPTPPSSSPSSFVRTANMHLASPPPTPTSTLAQAHATASCHILPQVYQNIGGDMDCEGPCVDCEMRHYEHYGRRSQNMDPQEQSAEEETRDQITVAGSSRICSNTSSSEIGTPSPEAQPEVLGVPLSTFDTSSSELDSPSLSFGVNAEASPHLDAQLEESGVEKEVSVSAFKVQDQSTIVDSPRMCLDRPCGKLDHRSRSFEANAEASPHVLEAQPEGPGIEPEVPLPASEAHPEESGGEPKATESDPAGSSKSPSHTIDLDALQRLIHEHELPLWHGLGAARMYNDGEPRGSGHIWTDEFEGVNGDFGGPSLEDGLQLGHIPDTGGSGKSRPDSPNELGRDDSGECEREQSLQIEYESGGIDGTFEESFKSAEQRSDVSFTPNDTLKTANTRDACSRDHRPEHFTDSEDSVQPEQPESEASCLGVQDQGDPLSQETTEILDNEDNDFTTLIDLMNAYTDGATSSLRSTYTEDLMEQESTGMHVEHEPEVTIDHQVHVEPETTPSAELSIPLEHTDSVYSPFTFATPPPSALPPSLSHLFRSLSPLSSLGEESPPILPEEIDAGDEEGQDEIGVKLYRTENLASAENSGVYQSRAHSGSPVSVLRRKMLLRSLRSGELRGGPGASIEELSILAKKDPRKIMISELKRKLDPLERAMQSRPPKKKTRFHADMDATSFSTDDVAASFTYLAHQLQCQGAGNPMPQSSDPSKSAKDVMSLLVESISAPMGVASTSFIGTTTISEPAQNFVTTSKITKSGLAANAREHWDNSISRGKRARPLSWKASQATTQKNVQQFERKPKSQRPQKRKLKPLAIKDEVQMCQWPEKSEQNESFQRQFVQCDNCDSWYHFGCAGFSEGDPRLEEPDSVFICPPCFVSSAKRQTPRRRAEICARPDCSLTQLDAEEYIIERLVGRRTIGEAGYQFLVKWEGYPIAQASWIPEGSISGVSKVFDQFVADATAEGINISPKDAVLLEEARRGGWDI